MQSRREKKICSSHLTPFFTIGGDVVVVRCKYQTNINCGGGYRNGERKSIVVARGHSV
jgi:hypothetical protein